MGLQDVQQAASRDLRRFTKQVLTDLLALEQLIESGRIESGIRRIGAEQELFIIDSCHRASPRAAELLKKLDDEHFTPELAQFNLEFNLDPLEFSGDCLSRLEHDIWHYFRKARAAAHELHADVVMCGILPTLVKSDLDLENMTPMPRYFALNDALTNQIGGTYHFRLRGLDELNFKHSSVMLEACNTSFQLHYQTSAEEFASLYNISQVATAPVLAAASNSPLLFGKRLWKETRVALFQQSLDTRSSSPHLRDVQPRVSFGTCWVKESVLEIFREDVSRFRVLIAAESEEDPLAIIEAGGVPKLKALQTNNSTVYRWNRPCYGISNGVPHLRIENRALPAGPTPIDEVANATFWYGLMTGFSREYPDITQSMEFDDARDNFFNAARHGLDASFQWLGGSKISAKELITKELVPLARTALIDRGLDSSDVNRYMDVIEERTLAQKTGSQWLLNSISSFKNSGTRGERLAALTAGTISNQQNKDLPGHKWDLAKLQDSGGITRNFARVEQYMVTDLITVNQDELVDLVANMMDWQKIRHVPVEDQDHRLIGLISYRSLLRALGRGKLLGRADAIPVSEIMRSDIITIGPNCSTLDAIQLMRDKKVGCLPVVKDDRLVGLVTEWEFIQVARELLEDSLRSEHG